MAITQEQIISVRSDILEEHDKVDFWRTATEARFGDVFWQTINHQSGKNIKHDKWLHRRVFESDNTFFNRARSVKDPATTKSIVSIYAGYLAKCKTELTTGFNKIEQEAINKNIDRQRTDLKAFYLDSFQELLSVAQKWVLIDRVEEDFPHVVSIPREDILDYAEDEKGFSFVKFKRIDEQVIEFKRVLVEQIVIIMRDVTLVYQKKDNDDFILIDTIQNELGIVPIVRMQIVNQKEPIISSLAHYQLDIMNVMSEMRNTLRNQDINLLVLAEDLSKNVEKLTANSILPRKTDDPAPMWIGPPPGTLDPHFRYLELLGAQIKDLAAQRFKNTSQAESAESKTFDWIDTESVFSFGVEAIENGIINIIEIMGIYKGKKEFQVEFEINKEFIKFDRTEFINNALNVILAGVDSNTKKILK